MDTATLRANASKWLDTWNKRDLDALMDYYADEAELSSPYVVSRWKLAEGKISGKDKLREHFQKAFESGATLELVDVLEGVTGVILLYKNNKGIVSADVIELTDDGKVRSVKSYYSKAAGKPD